MMIEKSDIEWFVTTLVMIWSTWMMTKRKKPTKRKRPSKRKR